MSTDAKVTKQVMQTLADGREGFEKGATKLDESNAPELAGQFRMYGNQRDEFYRELEVMARNYGDNIEDSGSAVGALHRGWMTVKDALAGSDPDGVLDAAEQGEDHAMKVYQEALEDPDVSTPLRTVLQRQASKVRAAHDSVRDLRNGFQN